MAEESDLGSPLKRSRALRTNKSREGLSKLNEEENEKKLEQEKMERLEARKLRLEEKQRLEEERHDAEEDAASAGQASPGGKRVVITSPDPAHRGAENATSVSAVSSLMAGDLAIAHASLQAKHKDTLLTLARLQNSKATITYQIHHLKDRIEELEDRVAVQSKELAARSHAVTRLAAENEALKRTVDPNGEAVALLERAPPLPSPAKRTSSSQAITEAHHPLEKQLTEAKLESLALVSANLELKAQVEKLKADLAEALEKSAHSSGGDAKAPLVLDEIEQGTVARLEATVKRLRAAVATAEENEDEAKKEMRKAQRELRTLTTAHEELTATLESTKQSLERLRARRRMNEADVVLEL